MITMSTKQQLLLRRETRWPKPAGEPTLRVADPQALLHPDWESGPRPDLT